MLTCNLHQRQTTRSITRSRECTLLTPSNDRAQWPLACWDCGFETRRVHRYLSVVSVECCQVEGSATGRSLVQRSPTICVCVCVCGSATVRSLVLRSPTMCVCVWFCDGPIPRPGVLPCVCVWFCNGPIPRLEESYQVCACVCGYATCRSLVQRSPTKCVCVCVCVCVCHLETSTMKRPMPQYRCCDKGKKKLSNAKYDKIRSLFLSDLYRLYSRTKKL